MDLVGGWATLGWEKRWICMSLSYPPAYTSLIPAAPGWKVTNISNHQRGFIFGTSCRFVDVDAIFLWIDLPIDPIHFMGSYSLTMAPRALPLGVLRFKLPVSSWSSRHRRSSMIRHVELADLNEYLGWSHVCWLYLIYSYFWYLYPIIVGSSVGYIPLYTTIVGVICCCLFPSIVDCIPLLLVNLFDCIPYCWFYL